MSLGLTYVVTFIIVYSLLLIFCKQSGFEVIGVKVILWLHLLRSFITEKLIAMYTVIFSGPVFMLHPLQNLTLVPS